MQDSLPYLAIFISGLTLVIMVGEKLFGGGNALANKFNLLDKETTAEIAKARYDLNLRIDEYEKMATTGFEATRANIHAMQLGILEFRAKMSEGLHDYIRKDDYNAGIGDVRREVHNGFRSLEERLGQLQDLIMYVNPDASPPQPVNKVHRGA